MRQARVTAFLSLVLLNAFAVAASFTVAVFTPRDTMRQPATGELPPVVAGRVPLRPVGGAPGAPAPSRLAAVLGGPLRASGLGDRLAATVVDATTGRTLYRSRATTMATPASTTKLMTAAAVLATAGPDRRLTTRVVRGSAPGSVVLVGGGDPMLVGPDAEDDDYPRFARLGDLAERTARRLRAAGRTTVTLGYDTSLFSGPPLAPTWDGTYVATGNVAPVTALAMNEGMTVPGTTDHGARVSEPAEVAAATFAELLRSHGLTVRDDVGSQRAPQGARVLAKVRSPPLSTMVSYMLTHSNNYFAETLCRQVALHRGKPATFEGAANAVEQVVAELGVTEGVKLRDCSGLSPRNKISPAALAELLAAAASPRHSRLRPAITGMPVGNFSGTLTTRFGRANTDAGQGVVRAKTGTLSGVSSLAGIVRTESEHLLAFSFVANGVPSWRAAPALDRLAAALASCGCKARPSQARTASGGQ